MMFPVEQSNELVFPDPLIFEDNDKLLEELLADHILSFGNDAPGAAPSNNKDDTSKKRPERINKSPANVVEENKNTTGSGGNETIKNNERTRQRKSSSPRITDQLDGDEKIKKKKVVHREIEKQRRQEMALLCDSLRSLLPPEFIKGKRSLPDHLQEAVNYIKHMESSIQELKSQRDKLIIIKKSRNVGTICGSSKMKIGSTDQSVIVNPSVEGVAILISSSLKPEEFPLSKMLADLLERGLNVNSCVSSKANDKSYHRIQIEANGVTASIDLSMLQEKLMNVIKGA